MTRRLRWLSVAAAQRIRRVEHRQQHAQHARLLDLRQVAGLDERRAAVGLPPIEEYLALAESEIGVSIDRSNLITD